MKEPPPIEIEEAEVERLIEQARQGVLDATDQKRLVPLLRTLLWLQRTLLETRISLAKLKKVLFGKRTEKPTRKRHQAPDGEDKSDPASEAEVPSVDAAGAGDGRQSDTDSDAKTGSGEQARVGIDVEKSPPRPGHGRLGAADYPGAETRFCPHEELEAGDRCPACARGGLYPLAPLVRLRFTGQPLVSVTRYELQRLRCGACGALWIAHMPPEASRETYAVSLKVTLAVAHYHLGLPFKRIESFQRLVGMALPDATCRGSR